MTKNFVDINDIDNSILVDLKYSTHDNFTGTKIYDFKNAILRKSTALKLAKVNLLLKEQGYLLKIWDAYRPLSAQQILWDTFPNEDFVAKPNPNRIRGHQLGATIDITLCDLNGNEIEMQSRFDDFSERASRNYKRNTLQDKYYQVMDSIMNEVGFEGYEMEWWHYSDVNQDFPPEQVDPNKYQKSPL